MKKEPLVILTILLIIFAGITVYCSYPDDGGWYLMAAEKIASGKVPYRDFFFPQGPIMVYLYSFSASSDYPVIYGRIQSAVMSLIGLFCMAIVLVKRRKSLDSIILFLTGCILYPLGMSFFFIVKTHSPVIMFFGFVFLAHYSNKKIFAGIFLVIISVIRVSMFPILILYVLWQFKTNKKGMFAVTIFFILFWLSIYSFSEGKVIEHLFIPMKLISFNKVSVYFNSMKGNLSNTDIILRKFVLFGRGLIAFPFLFIAFFLKKDAVDWKFPLFTGILLSIIHLLPDRPYDEYFAVGFVLMMFAISLKVKMPLRLSKKMMISILLISFIIPYSRIYSWSIKKNFQPYLPRLRKQVNYIDDIKSEKKWYILDCYIAIKSKKNISSASGLGKFSFLSNAPDDFVDSIGIYNKHSLIETLKNNELQGIYINDLSMGKDIILAILKQNTSWKRKTIPEDIYPFSSQLWINKGL